MTDESNIERHTLAVLREILERLRLIEEKQDAQGGILNEHSNTLAGHSKILDILVNAVSIVDRNQQLQTELLKELAAQGKSRGARLNAIDGRLGLIDQRVGLVDV